jgi:hypothetical protein
MSMPDQARKLKDMLKGSGVGQRFCLSTQSSALSPYFSLHPAPETGIIEKGE